MMDDCKRASLKLALLTMRVKLEVLSEWLDKGDELLLIEKAVEVRELAEELVLDAEKYVSGDGEGR